jgi:glutamate-ammonia-ligase adenylyltransferase
VQTLQLVWGGRDPGLRDPTTLGALRLLARAGHIPRRAATELARAYGFLRGVEHRLQMVADRQTHTLPERPEDLRRIALFLGYPSPEIFAGALLDHLGRVRARYADVFKIVPESLEPVEPEENLDFSGEDLPEETEKILREMGFSNARGIGEAVRGWQAGRIRALRSQRARELIRKMLPGVLAALARQPQPDTVFGRFDALLAKLPAGVPLLSLFEHNPSLLDRVATVLGAAPMLADHLSRHPAALDGLIAPEENPDPARLLRARLRDASVLEDAIEIIRRVVREEDFSVSVAAMEGRLGTDPAGARRTAIADATLAALLPRVLADFAARNGHIRGGGMAVVALGKAGGSEMMAGSDLDLMLIYDHPENVTESRGTRRLPVSQWFVRAAHAMIAAVTAPGVDGPLYAVDMRLRPSGNKGPVAVSLPAFRRYHAEDAWTWERMALTRARVIAGPPALRARITAALAEALSHAGSPEKIRADTTAMRARLARELPPEGPWDVKHRPGGLMEVEFLAQALQLIHVRKIIGSQTTRLALARLAEANLLPAEDAAHLIRADRVWRTVQGMLRITLGRDAGESIPAASAALLLRATAAAGAPAKDVADLRATLDIMAKDVRAVFTRQLGNPDP